MAGHPYRTPPPIRRIPEGPAPVSPADPLDWLAFALVAALLLTFFR